MYTHNIREMTEKVASVIGAPLDGETYTLIFDAIQDYWWDKIAQVWGTDDVQEKFEQILEENQQDILYEYATRRITLDYLDLLDARTILRRILDGVDAEQGITWDTVESEIEDWLKENGLIVELEA